MRNDRDENILSLSGRSEDGTRSRAQCRNPEELAVRFKRGGTTMDDSFESPS